MSSRIAAKRWEAVIEAGRPVVAAVCNPATDELFDAYAGGGANWDTYAHGDANDSAHRDFHARAAHAHRDT